MACKRPILVLTHLFVVLQIALSANCPSVEDVAPCKCIEFGMLGPMVKCHQIDDKGLAKASISLRGKKFRSVTIGDSKLGSIPQDVFKGARLKKLAIDGSTLTALTDASEAFVGLEDCLENLDITDCVFAKEWDFSVLRNLKKLKELSINGGHMETIGEDLKMISVSSMQYLSFRRDNISFVSDRAFESYQNLDSLILSSNRIKNVKRTMLPNPALKLQTFDIRYNLIEQFPEDMFTNMPKLRDLYISYNKILVLDEKTFSPVWEQLYTFSSLGNALNCDCRMSWLLKKRSPDGLNGKCEEPQNLKGKRLQNLRSKDFVCYL